MILTPQSKLQKKEHVLAEKCIFLHMMRFWRGTNQKMLQEGFRAQESRTLAHFPKSNGELQ